MYIDSRYTWRFCIFILLAHIIEFLCACVCLQFCFFFIFYSTSVTSTSYQITVNSFGLCLECVCKLSEKNRLNLVFSVCQRKNKNFPPPIVHECSSHLCQSATFIHLNLFDLHANMQMIFCCCSSNGSQKHQKCFLFGY